MKREIEMEGLGKEYIILASESHNWGYANLRKKL